MKNIVPTNISEVKTSLDSWRNSFSSTFKQLMDKGKELQQVTEQFFVSPIGKDYPRMDMIEGGEDLYIVFELAGLPRDQFQLELASGLLILRGEKQNPLQNQAGGIHHSECLYGKFERSVVLPCKVVEEKVEADFKNGVLTVKLPKVSSPASPRVTITINVRS